MDIGEIGFERPKNKPLGGTVKPYSKHLLVCTGHTGWPAKIEDDEGFLGALARAAAAEERQTSAGLKITACDEPSGVAGTDVLVFPDGERYAALYERDIPYLLAELQGETGRLRRIQVMVRYLLVCVHEQRDARCGYCGPILANLFEREAAALSLSSVLTVRRTSHVGGHEYAGNVIVYPEGDWYGYVTPADVKRIVAHAIVGKTVTDLWRGRMG